MMLYTSSACGGEAKSAQSPREVSNPWRPPSGSRVVPRQGGGQQERPAERCGTRGGHPGVLAPRSTTSPAVTIIVAGDRTIQHALK